MILIVDDKAENIFSLKRTLEIAGFEVDAANSGEEALKKILKNLYSLIILDVQMPGMDGFEVAEAISGYSKGKDIPIIFLSAVNTEKRFITKGYTSGGVDYVTKPIDPDVFILKVKTLHRLCEQNRELNRIRLDLLEEVETRTQAEHTLTKAMQELRSTIESIPQIAFTLKTNGEIEFVNEHWYVYSDDEKKMPVFHPDDSAVAAYLTTGDKDGKPFVSEVRIKNILTGLYHYHLLKVIPVKQGNTILKWVGTFTDIQEQKTVSETLEIKVKERTEELLNKNKQLEASNHELQQFASVASHDLKEPVRKIQIFSSILKERYANGDEDALNKIDRINDASRRMNELINDLLDYSRLSVDALFKKTALKELAQEIVHDLEFIIEEKKARIEIGEMPEVEVIPGQIRQVFQNLISNSLKFSRPDVAPVIKIWAEILAASPEDEMQAEEKKSCRIVVSDNGIGFNEKYLDRIFTIFQRLNAKDAYEGTGIGLAIVKKIVEKHHGMITAQSTEGEGASFIISLPLRQAPELLLESEQNI